MKQTAIVIGATGLVGQALVDRLISCDCVTRIITLTRRPHASTSTKLENHVVDFEKLDQAATLFRGHWLFSCLGTTKKQAGSIDAQRKVDLDYQYQAARISAEQGVEHYLLVSSSGANAQSRSAYLQMKGELEEKVQNLPFGRISIFQPSLLLGDRSEQRMGEALGSLVLPALTKIPGLRRYRPIRGGQVAEKMVRVSQKSGQRREWFRLDEIFQP